MSGKQETNLKAACWQFKRCASDATILKLTNRFTYAVFVPAYLLVALVVYGFGVGLLVDFIWSLFAKKGYDFKNWDFSFDYDFAKGSFVVNTTRKSGTYGLLGFARAFSITVVSFLKLFVTIPLVLILSSLSRTFYSLGAWINDIRLKDLRSSQVFLKDKLYRSDIRELAWAGKYQEVVLILLAKTQAHKRKGGESFLKLLLSIGKEHKDHESVLRVLLRYPNIMNWVSSDAFQVDMHQLKDEIIESILVVDSLRTTEAKRNFRYLEQYLLEPSDEAVNEASRNLGVKLYTRVDHRRLSQTLEITHSPAAMIIARAYFQRELMGPFERKVFPKQLLDRMALEKLEGGNNYFGLLEEGDEVVDASVSALSLPGNPTSIEEHLAIIIPIVRKIRFLHASNKPLDGWDNVAKLFESWESIIGLNDFILKLEGEHRGIFDAKTLSLCLHNHSTLSCVPEKIAYAERLRLHYSKSTFLMLVEGKETWAIAICKQKGVELTELLSHKIIHTRLPMLMAIYEKLTGDIAAEQIQFFSGFTQEMIVSMAYFLSECGDKIPTNKLYAYIQLFNMQLQADGLRAMTNCIHDYLCPMDIPLSEDALVAGLIVRAMNSCIPQLINFCKETVVNRTHILNAIPNVDYVEQYFLLKNELNQRGLMAPSYYCLLLNEPDAMSIVFAKLIELGDLRDNFLVAEALDGTFFPLCTIQCINWYAKNTDHMVINTLDVMEQEKHIFFIRHAGMLFEESETNDAYQPFIEDYADNLALLKDELDSTHDKAEKKLWVTFFKSLMSSVTDNALRHEHWHSARLFISTITQAQSVTLDMQSNWLNVYLAALNASGDTRNLLSLIDVVDKKNPEPSQRVQQLIDTLSETKHPFAWYVLGKFCMQEVDLGEIDWEELSLAFPAVENAPSVAGLVDQYFNKISDASYWFSAANAALAHLMLSREVVSEASVEEQAREYNKMLKHACLGGKHPEALGVLNALLRSPATLFHLRDEIIGRRGADAAQYGHLRAVAKEVQARRAKAGM
ncbi:MAG: hypothetical protein DHS20C10_07830 [marine bacterium B5-7]|nr:MAG: hypothetical protein DHS20C10_07830 [marine bacterium B5-7]